MDLKDKFEENRAFVDDAALPEGDLDLFMEKVGRKRLTWKPFAIFVPACAAALAAAVIVVMRPKPSAEKVYLDYLAYVETSRQELSEKDSDGLWLGVFDSVADESVPILDVLPDDMSEAAKTAVVKEHYDDLRSGLETIMENIR